MSYDLNPRLHIAEKENNTTFVTTAIDYPNALPHIGTAFEKIGADAYARFRRFQGREVYFLMGNDENTAKVVNATPPLSLVQDYVDGMAAAFKQVWSRLDISYDDFIQTSEERHRIGVQQFLEVVNKAGYIEKRPYKALYCEGCEEFKSSGIVDGKCPNHPNQPLVQREEENYFFLLSKFKQMVLDLIYPTPFLTRFLSVEPDCRYNEVVKFIETELQDISISRQKSVQNRGWGIPIPWDDTQVVYVWFDALLNYLTAIGFGTDWEKFNKYWPAECHFIGKDITRFHAALFPAMIEAYNKGAEGDYIHRDPNGRKILMPLRIFAHGFIMQRKDGKIVKSSKSGDAVNPVELIDQFGSDAYRYYFLAKCNYDTDGEFSKEHFQEVYNADLANNLGNLVSRVLNMVKQYFDGSIPASEDRSEQPWLDEKTLNDYESLIVEACSFRHALELTWKIVAAGNQFVDQHKPWELAKNNKDACAAVLRSLVANLRIVSLLLTPFLPKTAEKIYGSFDFKEPASWELLQQLAKNNKAHEGVSVSATLKDGVPPLFPRIK